MGIIGSLEYLNELLIRLSHKHKKRRPLQTVALKVRMDCGGCELKMKNVLSSMKGVKNVDVNRKLQKVTVTGYVDPKKVLKRVQSTKKKVEMWPYVPYNLVANPYVAGAYDKKAPSGFVRKTEASQASTQEYQFIMNMFNDENPNACYIM